MDFGIRMFAALFLGGAIGLERQWRQRMTGLRTNRLVAVGSAMFVMMGGLIAGNGSQGRVVAYVVSGIGFLGGGRDSQRWFQHPGNEYCRDAVVHRSSGNPGGSGAPRIRGPGSLGRTFGQPDPSPDGASDQSR